MRIAGLVVTIALFVVLLARETRRVRASTAERRRRSVATDAEFVLWGACAALVLPRLLELMT